MSATELTVSERIIAAIDKAALDALEQDALARPRAIAESVRGIVVVSEADVRDLTDKLSAIKAGQRAAKAALEGVTSTPKRAIERARGRFDEITALFAEAEAHAKRGIAGYIAEQERLARVERERKEKEAREIAERQREAAEAERERLEAEARAKAEAAQAAEGAERERLERESALASVAAADVDDAPPPMEVVAEPVDTRVRSRAGFVHMASVLKVELVDPAAVMLLDSELLVLRARSTPTDPRPGALDRFREQAESIPAEFPEGGIVWNGMRFWRERSVVAR